MSIRKTLLATLMLSACFSAPAAWAHEPTKPVSDTSMQGMPMQGMPQSKGSMELHQSMMKHDMNPPKMTGDTDRDFAAMMIMHHESGIRMMDVEMKHGKNATLKAMAKKMRDQQAREIAELKKYR